MHSITVTQKTTLAELQAFAQDAGGNDKIRATRNQDGSFTLYASSKIDTGFKNLFTDQRADRRAAAREAVETVLTAVKGSHVDAAMRNVLQGLAQGGEMRGADLAGLLTQTAAARQQGAATTLSSTEIATLLHDGLTTGNPDTLEAATAKLADRVAESVRGKPRDVQLDFAASRGDAAKNQLLQLLAGRLDAPGPLATSYAQAPPELRQVLDAAYDKAMQNLSSRRLDPMTIRVDDPASPTGYTDYSRVDPDPKKHLAVGGYGAIDLYRAADGREVVVKSPLLKKNEKMADKFDEGAREVMAHRAATAGNPANIVPMVTALRTEGGGLEIVLPYMPRGNADEAATEIRDLRDQGTIPKRDASVALLRLFQDQAEGTSQLHARGLISMDDKAPNVLIDGNGKGYLTDFGTASTGGPTRSLGKNPVVNPLWKAPEVILGEEARAKNFAFMKEMNQAARASAEAALDKNLPDKDKRAALQKLDRQHKERLEAYAANPRFDFTVTNKVDSWSLGIDLYKSLTGSYPFDGAMQLDTEEALKSHAAFDGRVELPKDLDLGLSRTEIGHVNALLAGLLHPDPNQRLSADQALQNPIFAMAELGQQGARDTIKLATT